MVECKTYNSREEWLAARQSYIGGSDAGCIVGMNPFQNNVELWELKTGRRKPKDLSENPFVQYGTKAEEYLRCLFQLDFPQYKVEYFEHNMWTNSEYPFAHASLDGWLTDADGRRGILEIKTATIQSAAQKAKWQDRIPDSYYAQCLHYLFVTGFEFVKVKAQLKFEYDEDVYLTTKHYTIERSDVEDDIRMLIEAEQKFCEYLVTDKCPPLVLPNI